MPNEPKKSRFIDARHPHYNEDALKWLEWRETYEGGDLYLRKYLQKFSERESPSDFETRKLITPIPTFAKGAVNDIRNSIFQRLCDVTRRGGSKSYMSASSGEDGGVDNKGSSMQSFIGIDLLTEVLVMGRAGVYIDNQIISGNSLADVGDARPYLYVYAPEDILAWSATRPDHPGEFSSVLLRDTGVDFQSEFGFGIKMPTGTYTRYRLVWLNELTGKVNMMFYDEKNNPINFDGLPTVDGVIELDLDRIPFVLLDIGSSLLKDVSNHQKALLNLGSSDVAYALKANYPFYTEQKDLRAVGAHLKDFVLEDGTVATSENNKVGREYKTGTAHGRAYDLKAERPAFIHPSPEPLMASMKLQEKLEDDIRKLVNLAVQNKVGKRVVSAEALKLSDQGLEAGLSYIGLVLESAERKVAQHWAAYESRDKSKRTIALVKYPDRYSLKDNKDRVEEAKALSDLMYTVPGGTVKRELSKTIVTALLGGRVDTDRMDKIFKEIDAAGYTTSNPDIIIRANESGLVGDQEASKALGFSDDEYLKAREDHAVRSARIIDAQGGNNPGARGVNDLDINEDGGEAEQAAANETTLKVDAKKPQRGEGKSLESK